MNNVKKFQKRIENFECENCHTIVKGNGFTNHCPKCLCSKHVDIFPGDRLEDCGGIMPVVKITKKGNRYVLVHRCERCKYENGDHFRENQDNFETLIKLSKKLSKKI